MKDAAVFLHLHQKRLPDTLSCAIWKLCSSQLGGAVCRLSKTTVLIVDQGNQEKHSRGSLEAIWEVHVAEDGRLWKRLEGDSSSIQDCG